MGWDNHSDALQRRLDAGMDFDKAYEQTVDDLFGDN
jgi:hypothetical protein